MVLLQKYNFQKYRSTNNRNKEMQITGIHEYKLHKYRNKMTKIKKYKLQK